MGPGEAHGRGRASADRPVRGEGGPRHRPPRLGGDRFIGSFGLDPADAPLTTFSIGIDTPEATRLRVREAEAYPVLKIKVGLDSDEKTLGAVRSVTQKPLRVDANDGWKDKEEAARKIDWLAAQGVELIEQPLPAAMIEEQGWLRGRVDLDGNLLVANDPFVGVEVKEGKLVLPEGPGLGIRRVA